MRTNKSLKYDLEIEKLRLPENVSYLDQPFFEPYLIWNYRDPKITFIKFSFVFNRGTVTNIFLRPQKNILPWPDFYKNHNRFFFIGELIKALRKTKIRLSIRPKYYYCINEFSNNYFHWITEVLPKMVFAGKVVKNTNFFIPFELSAYQIKSLNLCNIRYFQNNSEVTFFARIGLIENISAPGCYHPELLNSVRNIILAPLQIRKSRKRKLYVTRKNALRRYLVNEVEVCSLLLERGFEILDFDNMDFLDQVLTCMNASIMVSIHGAALSNMIFMDKNSVILEFLPKDTFNDKCYFTLAEIMKHQYYYLFCETSGDSHITSDFTVDAGKLREILDTIVL